MYVMTSLYHKFEYISYILLAIATITSLWHKRNCQRHIISALFFFASILSAIGFYIQDLYYIFSTQNMKISTAFIFQQNSSLFLSLLVMSLFTFFSVLIEYKILTISPHMRKALWLGSCIIANFCGWHHMWQYTNLNPALPIDTYLLLYLAPSLKNYMLFSFIYFCFIEGIYCNKERTHFTK